MDYTFCTCILKSWMHMLRQTGELGLWNAIWCGWLITFLSLKWPGHTLGHHSIKSVVIDHGGLSKGHQDNVTAPIVTFSTVAENEPTLQMKWWKMCKQLTWWWKLNWWIVQRHYMIYERSMSLGLVVPSLRWVESSWEGERSVQTLQEKCGLAEGQWAAQGGAAKRSCDRIYAVYGAS